MSEYNQYVTTINKIFDYLAKMKAGWNDPDNYSHIESIEEYKQIVVNSVKLFSNETKTPTSTSTTSKEVLGND